MAVTHSSPALQDLYPDHLSHCYGCGRLNEHGLRLRSFPDGDTVVARFTPAPEHLGFPGFVYGGLIASVLDCHGIATAAFAALAGEGRTTADVEVVPRYVTASLTVNYRKPTPTGEPLILRGRPLNVEERKVLVQLELGVEGQTLVDGELLAVRIPEAMLAGA